MQHGERSPRVLLDGRLAWRTAGPAVPPRATHRSVSSLMRPVLAVVRCNPPLKPEPCSWSGWNGQLGRPRRQLVAESNAPRAFTIECARCAHGCRAGRPTERASGPFHPDARYAAGAGNSTRTEFTIKSHSHLTPKHPSPHARSHLSDESRARRNDT